MEHDHNCLWRFQFLQAVLPLSKTKISFNFQEENLIINFPALIQTLVFVIIG